MFFAQLPVLFCRYPTIYGLQLSSLVVPESQLWLSGIYSYWMYLNVYLVFA